MTADESTKSQCAQAWKAKWAVFKIQGFVCKRFLPSFPSPSPLFYSLHFSRCNSLLPNPTETLATQATHSASSSPFFLAITYNWLLVGDLPNSPLWRISPVNVNKYRSAAILQIWLRIQILHREHVRCIVNFIDQVYVTSYLPCSFLAAASKHDAASRKILFSRVQILTF